MDLSLPQPSSFLYDLDVIPSPFETNNIVSSIVRNNCKDLRVNVIYNVETAEENILNEVIRLIKGIYIFVYVILV